MYRCGPWPEHRAIGQFYSVWLTPWPKLPLMLLFYKVIALFEKKQKLKKKKQRGHQTIVPSTDDEDIRLLNHNYIPSH